MSKSLGFRQERLERCSPSRGSNRIGKGALLGREASGHGRAPPSGLPLLQRSDEAGIRLDACTLSLDEGVGIFERHSVVADEICYYYR